MHKVVLFGKTGLLGSAIFERLSTDNNVSLVAPSRAELDVLNADRLIEFLNGNEFDVVINCTGFNDTEAAEDERNFGILMSMNVGVPSIIAQVCEEKGVRFIQFSTDFVFSGDKDGYSETDEVGAINQYGVSKADCEKAVLSLCSSAFIVRLSWVFGPGNANFVTKMLDLSGSRDSLSVVDDQVGKPTYTLDVAERISDFFDSDAYGIFHLPNEDQVSWYEFAREIFDISGWDGELSPISSSEFPSKVKRPSNSVLINGKIEPLRSHKEALEEYLNIIKL